jgi:hypothetical protein
LEDLVLKAIEMMTKCKITLLEIRGRFGRDWNWLYHHLKKLKIKDYINLFITGNSKIKIISNSERGL